MAKIIELDNKLKLIVHGRKTGASVSIAAWVGYGSRYEDAPTSGAAHFLEHFLFQGSQKRPSSRAISEAIEGIGGILEAYTGQEATCYFTKVPAYRLEEAFDVLADMVLNPLFREEDLEKERRVIIEEIRMHRDQPSDLGETLLFKLLFPDHPLGQDIAGSEASLADFTSPLLSDCWRRTYCGSNIVLAVCGHIDSLKVEELCQAGFGRLDRGRQPSFPPAGQQCRNRFQVETKDTAEAHLCLGSITISRHHPDHFALGILNAVLGVGASSRLFNEVRDRYGLAYYVHSSLEFFQDAGCQVVEAGCAPQNVPQVLDLIWCQMEKLSREGLPQAELNRVVEYIKGGFLLRLEDTLSQTLWLGEHLLLDGVLPSAREKIRHYERVTPEDVQRVAQQFFRLGNLSGVVVGPLEDETCWQNYRSSS
ncbi:MAG: pitrilysin family protein [Coprothermobacterota bacterium]|nr:pitrilysin family protein [Coprothermobacterota bacterium]